MDPPLTIIASRAIRSEMASRLSYKVIIMEHHQTNDEQPVRRGNFNSTMELFHEITEFGEPADPYNYSSLIIAAKAKQIGLFAAFVHHQTAGDRGELYSPLDGVRSSPPLHNHPSYYNEQNSQNIHILNHHHLNRWSRHHQSPVAIRVS